ncbi:MAG: zinc ribbon domain-containing protein [Deltaproteobacteria bacterium]|nr:zinc ribbon domain-containing protein [Deltaproteobacteria bacterium]MBW1930369.1 zinc ribbon domain-containing protein [Deltaproteobacteria bacterium]MBW2024029.1 zinc ribbon domain-containing protein [Deltaproteobacteria bacterium]MBW2126139.1 zinc ribbon domain-containing protein [Deltaproteobacteria bacterium]
MFFFIGGVQPKTVILDNTPRMCPSCGLYQARLKRTDHYLSLFFIPLFPIKRGQPFLECQSCGAISDESGQTWYGGEKTSGRTCPNCGKSLEPSYRYCPFCGRPVW